MMNRIAFRIAASTTIAAMAMVSASTQSLAMRGPDAAESAERAQQEAVQLHRSAVQALHQGQLSQATARMEQAVALSPRDAGYRLLLADLYMKSGRFEAARTTYGDVLELDPSHVRAGLSYALMQIALGRPQAAIAELDDLSGRADPADLGLAYALAGMPERAVEILEPEARAFDATARIRQNLALSYALAGDWRRARAVAAQDVSPADLGPRMEQWAAFARPGSAPMQVASLLGVNPVQDPGQPVQLALAPSAPAEQPGEAYAEAAPAPVYAEAAPVPVYAETAPAVYAEAQSAGDSDWGLPSAPDAVPAPAAVAQVVVPASSAAYYTPTPEPMAATSEEEVTFAAAAQSLIEPQAAVVRAAAVSLPPAPVFERKAPEVREGNSRYVVQLGAFSNPENAERAWVQAESRFDLSERQPLTTTIELGGRTLHRVSIAGFAGQTDAARMCASIRAQGGACFVRANAGDAAVRWAARYAPGHNRDA